MQMNSALFKKNLILWPYHSPNQKERQFFKKPTQNPEIGTEASQIILQNSAAAKNRWETKIPKHIREDL